MAKRSFKRVARKQVNLSQEDLIKTSHLNGDPLPLVVEPNADNVDVFEWAKNNREFIENNLTKHGGVLFRGFPVKEIEQFQEFMQILRADLLEYRERSTPRTQVQGKVYTSTEYPADQSIPFHNESSYSYTWPLKIWFYCSIQPDVGGETPIADSRLMYQKLDPTIVKRFVDSGGVMYVRNFGTGVDLSWQESFQTDDRAEVEEYCNKVGIQMEWMGEDRLRTRQVRQAIAKHPQTGEMLWFNQAHLFNAYSLAPAVRDSLLATFAEEDLPRQTYYGDGTPIETEVLDHITETFNEVGVKFPWQQGDILMLDNMLVAHSRSPFEGKRKIVVAMAEPLNQSQLEPVTL